jgi:outer membrane lipoprotein-sorting protein
VPTALVDSTTRAALRIAAGEAALITANVAALSKGTVNAMLWTRVTVVAVLASLAGAGLIIFSLGFATEAKAPPAAAGAAVVSNETVPAGRAAEPPEIIARMAETYAVAQSYEDEGEVNTVFVDDVNGRRRTQKLTFSTKFVRPKLFRFEFSQHAREGGEGQNRYVIWSNAGPTRCKIWWTIQPEIKEATLASAVGGANGISGGSSLTIPEFLLGAGSGLPFTGMHDFKLAGEETVDGAACARIDGKNIAGEPETVWIDKATFLVKKIVHKSHVPGSDVEQTTTYRPRLNVAIAPDAFTFVPPAVSKLASAAEPVAPPPVPPAATPRSPATIAAPAASPDTERRLADVERKLDRILRLLEAEGRARPAPSDPNEPR